jgi:hypothetical protein
MIPALVRGKLSREQENLEDLLTSMVFGQLRYLDYSSGFFRLFSYVDSEDFQGHLPPPDEPVDVDYTFWPWLAAPGCVGCEPDVIVTLRTGDTVRTRILVEAKHLSEKSSVQEPENPLVTDQLAKEWMCLVRYCELHGGRPLLVYLTAHHGRPLDDFAQAAEELQSKCPDFAQRHPIQGGWLSWRHISKAFLDVVGLAQEDLVALAERMGFRFFEGIHVIHPNPGALWKFSQVFRFGSLAGQMRSQKTEEKATWDWRLES